MEKEARRSNSFPSRSSPFFLQKELSSAFPHSLRRDEQSFRFAKEGRAAGGGCCASTRRRRRTSRRRPLLHTQKTCAIFSKERPDDEALAQFLECKKEEALLRLAPEALLPSLSVLHLVYILVPPLSSPPLPRDAGPPPEGQWNTTGLALVLSRAVGRRQDAREHSRKQEVKLRSVRALGRPGPGDERESAAAGRMGPSRDSVARRGG